MKSILVAFIGFIVLPSASAERYPRILGGRDANRREYPYMVSLIKRTNFTHRCGGTIISRRYILTAAHCLYKYNLTDLIIKAGKHNISDFEETTQVKNPTKFIVHEEFSPLEVGPNDIGLIKLSKPLEYSYAIKPIRLPKKNSIPCGSGIVSGWGSISDNMTEEYPHILKSSIIPILPNDVCKKFWKDQQPDYSDNQLCTGPLTGGIGPCPGDSGSPLVQDEPGGRTIVGIVSFASLPCGAKGFPQVFTRISAYIDWIYKSLNLII